MPSPAVRHVTKGGSSQKVHQGPHATTVNSDSIRISQGNISANHAEARMAANARVKQITGPQREKTGFARWGAHVRNTSRAQSLRLAHQQDAQLTSANATTKMSLDRLASENVLDRHQKQARMTGGAPTSDAVSMHRA